MCLTPAAACALMLLLSRLLIFHAGICRPVGLGSLQVSARTPGAPTASITWRVVVRVVWSQTQVLRSVLLKALNADGFCLGWSMLCQEYSLPQRAGCQHKSPAQYFLCCFAYYLDAVWHPPAGVGAEGHVLHLPCPALLGQTSQSELPLVR